MIEDVGGNIHVFVTAIAGGVVVEREILVMTDTTATFATHSFSMVIMVEEHQSTIPVSIDDKDIG